MGNPSRLEAVFFAALEMRMPLERAAYLDEACAGDLDLRRRVERMLAAQAQAGSFLEQPAPRPDMIVEGEASHDVVGTVVGPYKLMEQIGEGGMGLVFVAEQQQPVRRKVALKLIKPGMDSRQVIARFEAERQALAMMDHPNIAKVYDGGTTSEGRPFFVMEFVKGVPITDYCDRHRLTTRQRLELCLDVCHAVQHAHQKGVIHRDLKPSNVLVEVHDVRPVVKIIDFGVAKATGQALTEKTVYTGVAQLVGTPLYMSPEQAGLSSLDVDTRSDVYALGVLLYELLTGTTPFDCEALKEAGYDELRRIIREEEPPKPSTRVSTLQGNALSTVAEKRGAALGVLRAQLRGEIDWIVMKCLEKDRDHRYESASALAADLQRFLADEPVQACPPSVWYRVRKFSRRRKAGLAAIGLVLFCVVLLGGGAGWTVRDRAARQAKLNREVEHALDEAARTRDQALKSADNPSLWKAGLAEAASELKRGQGLAAQDESALEPATRMRLQALQELLDADEADRQFAVRFEEIRLEQTEVNVAISQFKTATAFAALKDAFLRHYGIEFGSTPAGQAVTLIRQRPQALQSLFLAALEVSLDSVPKGDSRTYDWLASVLEAADAGSWRKRAQEALRASDWKALDQVVGEAIAARQPPSLLLRLAERIPLDSPARVDVFGRIREAHPGDFWVNYGLAFSLQYGQPPRPEEAIRYHIAALTLRPHNPAECVNLGNALAARGELDGAIRAYREALKGHQDYAAAHERLALALEQKGDSEGAIAELRETVRLRSYVPDLLILGNMLVRNGLRDEAIANYRRAIELDPNLAIVHYNLGTVLQEKPACLSEAVASYREAIACHRRAISLRPADGDSHNNLAWVFLTCAYGPIRNPAEGLKLAQRAVELVPNKGAYWNTLGVAHYRSGSCKEAIAAFTKSMQLTHGGNSYDYFFLAMAHWQLGEKEEARRWYDQAVQWMDKNLPKGKELGRFRAEAAELLKIQTKEA